MEQAELLARYWGPILRGKALAGQLHVHVSAMQRCLQSAVDARRLVGVDGALERQVAERRVARRLEKGDGAARLDTQTRLLLVAQRL